MKFSSYFIDRPVFASVLSAFILIAGAIALFRLPVSEYPEVVPPSVVVSAAYPGANPKVISETVAAPLEQAIVGVENMHYMSSQATMDGTLALTVTFRIGTDIDKAQVQVQNRVAQARARQPVGVRGLGVSPLKITPAVLMGVPRTSPDRRYQGHSLRNNPTQKLPHTLARLPGTTADVVESPLDLRSSLQLQGRLDPAQPATMEARFVLRVLRDRGGAA